MRRISAVVAVTVACACVATPQGRPVDWPSHGSDARRTGWERSDVRITKDNIKDFQLVLKRKFDGPRGGARSLTAPVIIGLLISYKGFKELGFVASNSGDLWSIDVDTDKIFWHTRTAPKGLSGPCAELATTPTLTPPAVFGRRPAAAKVSASPGLPPSPAGSTTALPARLGGGGFGGARPLYVLAADGKLRQVNTSDGSDQFPQLDFLPADARPANLTMTDNTIYTTTAGCAGVPAAVWAINLASADPKVTSFPLKGGKVAGTGGFATGNDGTVYVQTGPGESDPAAGKWSDTLLALSPRTLDLQGYFTVSGGGKADSKESGLNVTTPVVFEFKGRDLIVSAGRDGRLYLLDSAKVGGEDHKTAVYSTPPIASGNGGIWGGLTSWENEDGSRWVAAPVWGQVSSESKAKIANGAAPNGSVVAFKVEEQSGKPVLTPMWISRDLTSPVPPVTTSGVVFALSTGGKGKATMFALDGVTGKELYSTGSEVSAPGTLTGMSLANGRVYFTTTDNTLYAFGIFLER